jgi:L-alanine-DL-glutamate epimerase-like enolase superfamily enzyme
MVELAIAVRERHGVLAFKVKVGRDVETDLAACRGIRAALPDADLYVDANRGWPTVCRCRSSATRSVDRLGRPQLHFDYDFQLERVPVAAPVG